jgi:hypothetical protein
MVRNPSWATEVLATSYETLEEMGVPARWLPKLTDVQARRGSAIGAHVHEYGCGAYGCVFPTIDPKVVLKITADDTEAQFAADLSPILERPICVAYHMVLRPEGARDNRGSQVYLLWRESADLVGKIGKTLGRVATDFIDRQHAAGQSAYKIISDVYAPHMIGRVTREESQAVRRVIGAWLETCEAMARQTRVPELRELGDGLVEVYRVQRILFGDIHGGNLGLVKRPDGEHWVITDPGHVAVVSLDD